MALIVQKYGGTSMGSPERIREVAKRIAHYHSQGHQLIVVPSAMSGETNRLLGLAKQLNAEPEGREGGPDVAFRAEWRRPGVDNPWVGQVSRGTGASLRLRGEGRPAR